MQLQMCIVIRSNSLIPGSLLTFFGSVKQRREKSEKNERSTRRRNSSYSSPVPFTGLILSYPPAHTLWLSKNPLLSASGIFILTMISPSL